MAASFHLGALVLAYDTEREEYYLAEVTERNGDMYTVQFRHNRRLQETPYSDLRPSENLRDLDTSRYSKAKTQFPRLHMRGVRFFSSQRNPDGLTPESISRLYAEGIVPVRECPICARFFRDFVKHIRTHGIGVLEDTFNDWTIPDLGKYRRRVVHPASKRPRDISPSQVIQPIDDVIQPTLRSILKSREGYIRTKRVTFAEGTRFFERDENARKRFKADDTHPLNITFIADNDDADDDDGDDDDDDDPLNRTRFH